MIVSVKLLDDALALQRRGCPVDGCKKPLINHSTTVNGSAAKITFMCQKGHSTQWTSSEQLGRQSLLLNRLVPAAAVMTGLKIAPTKRFLGLLSVDSHDQSYMKSSSLDLLMGLTQRLYDEEVSLVQKEMMDDEFFDLGMLLFPRRSSFANFLRFIFNFFLLYVFISYYYYSYLTSYG